MTNSAQSPHLPAEGARPGWGDLRWLLPFAVRGFVELIRARIVFSRLAAKDIPERNRHARSRARPETLLPDATLARIEYVLPRLSSRLPWRSDCLVQAIAGQNWLASLGASSEIRIGVELPTDGEFGAHAWLVRDEKVITGGDIEKYELLLSDSRLTRETEGDVGDNPR